MDILFRKSRKVWISLEKRAVLYLLFIELALAFLRFDNRVDLARNFEQIVVNYRMTREYNLSSHLFGVSVGREQKVLKGLALNACARQYICYHVTAEPRDYHGVDFFAFHAPESVTEPCAHNIRDAVFFGKFLRFGKRRCAYIRCDDFACPVRAYEIVAEFAVVAPHVRHFAVIDEICDRRQSLVKSYGHQSKSLSFLRRLGWRNLRSAFASI